MPSDDLLSESRTGPLWQGSALAELTPEEIHQSGDHELLNWIIALGILGDRPAEIIDVRESHTQLAFRVTAKVKGVKRGQLAPAFI